VAACPFQVKGRLLTGEEAVICKLAPGSCPFQDVRPTTGGRHTAVCLRSWDLLWGWQRGARRLGVDLLRPGIAAEFLRLGQESPPKRPRSEEEIRLCAYRHWEAAGKPESQSLRFWLEAEKEVGCAR
jgi:hypothetical protein